MHGRGSPRPIRLTCAPARRTPGAGRLLRGHSVGRRIDVIGIRDAAVEEAEALEALQRRSSDVWEAYREQLAAHPDAIELPQSFIDRGWVRVAVAGDGKPIGFSVVIPTDDQVHELDGLFVEPGHMHSGVGRAL